MWYKNIARRFFGLATKHACDRQNYDSQDRASIAASRGKTCDNDSDKNLVESLVRYGVAKSS